MKASEKLGERAHVQVDHRKLVRAVELVGRSQQGVARIVDDNLRL